MCLDEELPREMNFEAVTTLAAFLHGNAIAHLKTQADEAAVLEVLNALAAVTATILRATDFEPRFTQFFWMAFSACANAKNESETLQ